MIAGAGAWSSSLTLQMIDNQSCVGKKNVWQVFDF